MNDNLVILIESYRVAVVQLQLNLPILIPFSRLQHLSDLCFPFSFVLLEIRLELDYPFGNPKPLVLGECVFPGNSAEFLRGERAESFGEITRVTSEDEPLGLQVLDIHRASLNHLRRYPHGEKGHQSEEN